MHISWELFIVRSKLQYQYSFETDLYSGVIFVELHGGYDERGETFRHYDVTVLGNSEGDGRDGGEHRFTNL